MIALFPSQDNLQRKHIKRLIGELQSGNKNVRGNMFAALGNVRLTHLLDLELRRTAGVEEARGADPSLDGASHRPVPSRPSGDAPP